MLFDDASANLSLPCIVAHLKAHDINEYVLESVDSTFPGTEAECESFIRIKLDEFNEKILENMQEDENARQHVDCFRAASESEEYEITALRYLAVGMIDVGWKFWRSSAKEERYEQLKQEIDKLGTQILEKCAAAEFFGRHFDTAMEKRPSLEKGENEYCIRRYLIDQYLIDAFAYNLIINPKNITMENYNCEEIMRSILEPAYENLKKDETECSLKILKENNYYDQLLKLELLSKLTMTAHERRTERQKFVDAMFEITQKARDC